MGQTLRQIIKKEGRIMNVLLLLLQVVIKYLTERHRTQ